MLLIQYNLSPNPSNEIMAYLPKLGHRPIILINNNVPVNNQVMHSYLG